MKIWATVTAIAGWSTGLFGQVVSYNVRTAPEFEGFAGWPATVESIVPPTSSAVRHGVGAIYNLSGDSTLLAPFFERGLREKSLVFVEKNRILRLNAVQSGRAVNGADLNAYPHSLIRSAAAQTLTRGGGVTVAFIDTGSDYEHPDLTGRLWVNAAEDLNANGKPDGLDFNGVDDDGNGYVDDVIGYDFVHQPRSLGGGDYLFADPDPMDDNTHGTMVAGLALEVMPEIRVMTIRAFAAGGGGEDDDVARAFVYAADNGARVINCSFGDIYPSLTMRAAVEYAQSRGAVVIASAGQTTGDKPHYPSDYLGVISVSATGQIASGEEYFVPLSNFGVRVALSAPGAFVRTPALRTYGDSTGYGVFSGTSVSAPQVSAAAAAVLALYPGLNADAVKTALTTSADDLSPPGWDVYTGGGRLNVLRALEFAGQAYGATLRVHSPPHDGVVNDDSVAVVVSVVHPYYLSHRIGSGADYFGQTLGDTLFYLKKSQTPPGTQILTLKTTLSNGRNLQESVRFRFVSDTPKVAVLRAAPIWEENVRKAFIVFRGDERAQARLEWTHADGRTEFFLHDRLTRNGEFVLPVERAGEYRFRIHVTSSGDTLARSEERVLAAETGYIAGRRPDTLSARLPMGLYLNRAFDFDGDGRRELVMTRLDDKLVPAGVDFWEYADTGFALVDSIRTGIVLVKDAADFDGDGQTDLLANFSDNLYIFSGSPYPSETKYSFANTGMFPSRWVDLDGVPPLELIAKDTLNYLVCRWENERYVVADVLRDTTRDFFGSTAPNALFGDFNANGRSEIAFMDGDGDIFVYERTDTGWEQRLLVRDSDHGESSDFFTFGDFDGDGKIEFFSAVRPHLLRNEADFEYRPRYWRLRVYEPDSFRTLWEDYVYNVNSETWNAATVGDLDGEPGDEIVFSSFPRTYVVQGRGGYRMRWFGYGGLTLRHAVADWDGDGRNELAAGRGDSTFFLRFSTGDNPRLLFLGGRAKTTCDDSLFVELEWDAANADFYVVYEGEYDAEGNPPETLTFFAQTFEPKLSRLHAPARVVYVVEAYKNGVKTDESYFAEVWVRKTSVRAEVVSDNELLLRIDGPIFPEDYPADKFVVGDRRAISAIVAKDSALLLTFEKSFSAGANTLKFINFRDGYGNSGCDSTTFLFSPLAGKKYLWPVRWDVYDEKNAWIEFNADLTTAASENFVPFPAGATTAVELESWRRVKITIGPSRFGPTGEPLWVRIRGLRSADGRAQRSDEGDVVNFGGRGDFEGGVFVYPNPVRGGRFEGCRFAGVPRGAAIAVLTAAGAPVRTLVETEGWGGIGWDLTNAQGQKIQPGTYRFIVTAPDGKVIQRGGFAVLE